MLQKFWRQFAKHRLASLEIDMFYGRTFDKSILQVEIQKKNIEACYWRVNFLYIFSCIKDQNCPIRTDILTLGSNGPEILWSGMINNLTGCIWSLSIFQQKKWLVSFVTLPYFSGHSSVIWTFRRTRIH